MLLSEAIRKGMVFRCPCCHQEAELDAMLRHLNMAHFWHNGNIADWVAEQEKRLGVMEE